MSDDYISDDCASVATVWAMPVLATTAPLWIIGIADDSIRDDSPGGSYAVIGLAMGGDQQITVDGVANGVYRDAVTGHETHVGQGNISFHVKGNSAGIYVLDGPGKIGEDGVYLR